MCGGHEGTSHHNLLEYVCVCVCACIPLLIMFTLQCDYWSYRIRVMYVYLLCYDFPSMKYFSYTLIFLSSNKFILYSKQIWIYNFIPYKQTFKRNVK